MKRTISNKIKQMLHPVYRNWDEYKQHIDFLESFYFQQEIRNHNVSLLETY